MSYQLINGVDSSQFVDHVLYLRVESFNVLGDQKHLSLSECSPTAL